MKEGLSPPPPPPFWPLVAPGAFTRTEEGRKRSGGIPRILISSFYTRRRRREPEDAGKENIDNKKVFLLEHNLRKKSPSGNNLSWAPSANYLEGEE